MKRTIIILLAALALAGCDRHVSHQERNSWFIEDADEALSDIDYDAPAARDLIPRKQTLKLLTAALNRNDEQASFTLPATQFDARVTESIAVEFTLYHLQSLAEDSSHIGGETYYRPKVDFFQLITGLDVQPLVQDYYQRQAIDSLLYRHARAIFNDRQRLTNYYSRYRQAVLDAIYNDELNSDYEREDTLIPRLIEIRQGFITIATIEGREQVAAFLQEEERFDNLDWRDLKGDDYRKARDERQRHYQRGYEISPALFAYRRYTQSGNDIGLVDTYIDLLDDFIPAARETIQLAKHRRAKAERAMGQEGGEEL